MTTPCGVGTTECYPVLVIPPPGAAPGVPGQFRRGPVAVPVAHNHSNPLGAAAAAVAANHNSAVVAANANCTTPHRAAAAAPTYRTPGGTPARTPTTRTPARTPVRTPVRTVHNSVAA